MDDAWERVLAYRVLEILNLFGSIALKSEVSVTGEGFHRKKYGWTQKIEEFYYTGWSDTVALSVRWSKYLLKAGPNSDPWGDMGL